MNEVLERISNLAAARGVSDSQFCREVGIGQSTYATWKQKDREPQLKYVPQIAEYFGVSIDFLLTGKTTDDYYLDPEVSAIAQEMATRPELKVLFKASRNVSKESIEAINNMIQQMTKD